MMNLNERRHSTVRLQLASVAIAWLMASTVAMAAEEMRPPFYPGSETLVVIPDTEVFVCHGGLFPPMMEWIADNKDRRNINYVLHVGDVTNNNTKREWECAREGFDLIEGKVPYILAAGNHDYDHTPGRLTYMNDYFDAKQIAEWPTFGDIYEPGKLENQYHFTEIHGRKWIILSLEMGPRAKVIDWANKVLAEHKDRLAIILTHGYLYYGNERYNHLRGGQRASPYNFYGDGADGEMLWDQLVRKHPNVMMVICGHLSSQYVGYRKDEGDYGNVVHQMLVDYEKLGRAGSFLRLLEFLPDGKTVQVRTYSPVRDEINSPVTKGDKPLHPTELEQFTFELQTATRDEPKSAVELTGGLTKPPIHRYSFNGAGGHGAKLADSEGDLPGIIYAPEGGASLNGEGQLVITQNDGAHARLDPRMVRGRKKLSVEAWVTPTSGAYNWDNVFRFGDMSGGLWYSFRTATVHRAEISRHGHNEDIQRKRIPLKPGEPMHIVWAYDQTARDGEPMLTCYRDGRLVGELPTGIKLSELDIKGGFIGPLAGEFDELRVYDYALSPPEVEGSFLAGPDTLPLPQEDARQAAK